MLKSIFLFHRGFHQMTVLKSTFLINRGITNRHCFACSFKNKQSLHCCVCKLITMFSYADAYYLLHCCAIFFTVSTPHCCVYTCTACALFKDKILCVFWNNYTVPIYKFTMLCVNISYTRCCCIYCISIQ